MKLTAFPKTVFCLALLLCWGTYAPTATAQYEGSHPLYQDIFIPAPLQTVEVHTPRDTFSGVFESEARVFPNGEASGFLTLSNEVSTTRHSGGVNMIFLDGSVRFLPNGTVARVMLRGHTTEGDRVLVMITPVPSEDCLIYTTVGSDGVGSTWEAEGRLTVNR